MLVLTLYQVAVKERIGKKEVVVRELGKKKVELCEIELKLKFKRTAEGCKWKEKKSSEMTALRQLALNLLLNPITEEPGGPIRRMRPLNPSVKNV